MYQKDSEEAEVVAAVVVDFVEDSEAEEVVGVFVVITVDVEGGLTVTTAVTDTRTVTGMDTILT